MKLLRLSVLALVAAAGSVVAQDLSEEEMRARFRQQLDAMEAQRTDPSLGRTRGLVLSTVDPDQDVQPGVTVTPTDDPGTALDLRPGAGASVETHVNLPEDMQVNVRVTFAFDSAALSESQKPALRQICTVLRDEGVEVLRIVGHTDAAGPAGYNQQLSILRAEEVRRFFINDCGIPADRLQAIGVGEQFPADSSDPFAGQNRRVEFQAMG